MQIWEQFLSQLKKEWGAETIHRWLGPLKMIRFDAANIFLEAENSFQISWFEEHCRKRLEKNPLINNNGRLIQVHLSLPIAPAVSKNKPPPSFRGVTSDSLDPEMSFDHFLSSKKNDIPLQLLKEVGNCPTVFNPIYLYGPTGSGKTHLLMALASQFKQQGKNAFYVKAETFTEHVVQAMRLGAMQELRRSYRASHALLIDDVHLFARKNATQEEFFHTFNDLHTRGCPIVLASRFPPSKLTEIEPRLVSRFEWGIPIEVEKHTPSEILEKKAALWNLPLHPQLIPYLLKHFPSSPLIALTALALRGQAQGPIDPECAAKILKDLLEKEAIVAWTPEKIVKTVADHFSIPSVDLLGKSQMREATLPRGVAMYFCREMLKLPFQKIGEIFGRDHSTVMASIKKTHIQIEEKNPEILQLLEKIK